MSHLDCRARKGVAVFALFVAASYAGAQPTCGVPGTMTGKVGNKKVVLQTRVFPDGSIAVRVTDRRYGAISGSAYWRHQMIGA